MGLAAATLSWDPAGNDGSLENLDIANSDSNPSPFPANYYTGSYINKDGFLGRFVYTGEAGQELEFNNIGITPSGVGPGFYYTRTNDTSRYRKIFFVATIKGLKHNGGSTVLPGNNQIIETPGDSLSIGGGAGSEEHDTSSPEYVGGYNANAQWGVGLNYKYVHPFKYIWIDVTVIRTTTSNLQGTLQYLFGGSYELNVTINGDGISSTLYLTGVYEGIWYTPAQPDSYFFKLDRISPTIIPIQELRQRNNFNNRLPVGRLTYNSTDSGAQVYFSSSAGGEAVDFSFTSPGGGIIEYELVYDAEVPNENPRKIDEPYLFFGNGEIGEFMSPIYGETRNLYTLQGDLSIYVDQNFTPLSVPPGEYISYIYCFLHSL